MIEEAIISLLKADTEVMALLSGKITPVVVPQDSLYPCISYSVNEGEEDSTFDGQGTFAEINVEVDAWADNYNAARELANAIKAVFKNYRGTVEGVTIDAVTIDSILPLYEKTVDKHRRTILMTLIRR